MSRARGQHGGPSLAGLIGAGGGGDPGAAEPRLGGLGPSPRRVSMKGLDRFAARLRGVSARVRASRSRRARAERVLREAALLRDNGSRAFSERVDEARDAIRLGRGSVGIVDRAGAVCVEAVRRALGFELYPEQVMGALAMSEGRCVEMATGEGKTLTGIIPAALDGWAGRGVHVLTVNDYLAGRDASITRGALELLGLRVAVIEEDMDGEARREAYDADVTYAADKQVIFDFLRDRLVSPLGGSVASAVLDRIGGDPGRGHWTDRVMQRGLASAIVDEADSVLIDEAITPAILSIPESDASEEQAAAARGGLDLSGLLERGTHYEVDERLRSVRINDAGREVLESFDGSRLPGFWRGPRRREELARQAITARELYRRGDEYVVVEGDEGEREVVIVDRSTGRLLRGRQWQMGLHQAVEAKEGVTLTGDRSSAARVSYQQFFQRYTRLCGMSGTVWEVAGELEQWYGLRVEQIPTHRPVIRVRARDRVYGSEQSKGEAVARRVEGLARDRRAVLVGTRSVASSEALAERLRGVGLEVRVLNAEREAEEAAIVATAGRAGSVTVATNMAGRGTDIKLDEEARALGGLVVVATERNEERRVDRQLFGRAGRQGDPGRAESFVSFEDRVIRDYGPSPLVWLCRVAPGPAKGLVSWLLWRIAQRTATARLEMQRTEAAKAESYIDVSLGEVSR